MADIYDRHHAGLVVDPADDPIGAAACADPVVKRGQQALADTVWFPQERTGNELVGGCRNGLRRAFRERSIVTAAERSTSP